MAETKRWSGNDTTNISIYNKELDRLAAFVKKHRKNYIFGSGKIGSALAHYFKQAEFSFEDCVTSEDMERLQQEYHQGSCGIVMGVKDTLIPEIVPGLESFAAKEDIFILSSVIRENMGNAFSEDYAREHFWINIFTEAQCNLNCRSCSTFAPVCSPDPYALPQFENDMRQIKKLNIPHINLFNFTGGEAFLHPQLLELFSCARSFFPETPMNCYTNGLKLLSVKEDYLLQIRERNVTLIITEYPVPGLRLKEAYERLDRLGVSYNVIYSEGQKYFSKRPLDFTKSTPKYKYYMCPRYKMCDSLFLYRGRFYKCIYSFLSGAFNRAFGTKLVTQEKDYLDIYQIKPEDIYRFMISRVPYCGYCAPIEELVPWGLSERTITEWT